MYRHIDTDEVWIDIDDVDMISVLFLFISHVPGKHCCFVVFDHTTPYILYIHVSTLLHVFTSFFNVCLSIL